MPREFYLALITKYKLNVIANEPQKQTCGHIVNKTLLWSVATLMILGFFALSIFYIILNKLFQPLVDVTQAMAEFSKRGIMS